MKKGKMIKLLNASILSLCGGLMIVNSLSNVGSLIVKASGEKDVISSSSTEDWFQTEAGEGQGTWNANNGVVSVDAFGGAYAIEGATYLTKQGTALGAFEYSANIKVTELNNVQNPMVGIIPWYLDDDNYLYVQLKFTDDSRYLLSAEEKADGYAIEQIIVSGKYNGEAKYYTATSQQENTTYDALNIPALKSAKTAPKVAAGHNLKVKFENNSATATCYNITISYNDVVIGTTSAYYYNAIAKNLSTGFMAQDVKAEFSNAVINDLNGESLLKELATIGAPNVLLTGVSFKEGELGVASYNKEKDEINYYFRKQVPYFFHGTGDVYASSFFGALIKGYNFQEAMKIAVDFTVDAILETVEDRDTHWYGVHFEAALPKLIESLKK